MSTILYSQSNLPTLQNRVFKTVQQAENCPLGDIEIVEDYETGLVYNASFNPELVVYDSDYDNEQAVSPAFQEHLQSVADLIETELGLTGLIEVGCGKGFFLELLLQRNFDITGFDPTYQGSNPRIIKELFRPGLLGAARGLILRHVLEHIQNPVDFLLQLAEANGGGGLIYIEVPCFDWICERKAWFDIFYEHVNYFRISDFRNMFSRLLFAEKTFSGQYISVVADLSSLRKPQFSKENSVTFPEDFLESLPTKGSLEGDDKMVAVWGGGVKGSDILRN